MSVITEDKNEDSCSDKSSEEEVEVLRLNEMVRKQYFDFLKKQLKANMVTWSSKTDVHQHCMSTDMEQKQIHACAELLENEAIKACMVTKLYQRAMTRIIANVRRHTEEQRLENHLHELLMTENLVPSAKNNNRLASRPAIYDKATQTDICSKAVCTVSTSTCVCTRECDNNTVLTLDKKIDMFQERLKNETLATKRNALHWHTKGVVNLKRQFKKHSYADLCHKRRRKQKIQPEAEAYLSPITISRSHTPTVQQLTSTAMQPTELINDLLEEDDIAKELAQLFNEDKTELDEIFGIDPNAEPDDPQISNILKEIENAKLKHSTPPLASDTTSVTTGEQQQNVTNFNIQNKLQLQSTQTDLRHSLWPCELYMQRQRLTAALNRLIEEDFRWHDVIRWKFNTLFGQDSDDEYASCSPSIELDEVLLGSCVRRISPWLVKHLMKPLEDGLIGNRFLFKKLAKRLAYNIIMEHQYPDERIIKRAVENFFCSHQAVMSIDDLTYIPSISTAEDYEFKM